MRRFRPLAVLMAIIILTGTLPWRQASAAPVLTRPPDIAGHWAESILTYCYGLGFISTYEDGTLKPDQFITRAEFSQLMDTWMSMNEGLLSSRSVSYKPFREMIFYDMPITHPYYNGVRQIYGRGLIEVGGNYFYPDGPMNRAEICYPWVSLFKSFQSGDIDGTYFNTLPETDLLNAFSDRDAIPSAYRQSVAAMYDLGFINGYPDGSFNPTGNMTRAEACAVLVSIEGNLLSSNANQNANQNADQNSNEIEAVPTYSLELYSIAPSYMGNGRTELELSVNQGAVALDADVTLLFATTRDLVVTPENIHTINAGRSVMKLSELDIRTTSGDEIVFSAPFNHDTTQDYYVYAILNADGRASEVRDCAIAGDNMETSYSYSNGYTGIDDGSAVVQHDPADIELFNIEAPFADGTGFELELDVNDAAVYHNPDVLISYTADRDIDIDEDNIGVPGGSVYAYRALLGTMEDLGDLGDNIYKTWLNLNKPGRYYVYAMLKSGGDVSDIESCIVDIEGEGGLELYDADAYEVTSDGFEMRLEVNLDAAQNDTDVIYAYTNDPDMFVDATNIGEFDSGLVSQTMSLNAMTRLDGNGDPEYSRFVAMPSYGEYYFYVMLSRDGQVSEVRSFTVDIPAADGEPDGDEVAVEEVDIDVAPNDDGIKSITINVGQSVILRAIVSPYDASDKSVAWTPENSRYISINQTSDENGLVCEIKGLEVTNPGEPVTVTVTTTDGGKTDFVEINVVYAEEDVPVLMTAVDITTIGASIDGVQNVILLYLNDDNLDRIRWEPVPKNATDVDWESVEWKAYNWDPLDPGANLDDLTAEESDIVTFPDGKTQVDDKTGWARVVLTVKSESGESFTDQCIVKVTDNYLPVESITVEPAAVSLRNGQKHTFSVVVKPDLANSLVAWSVLPDDGGVAVDEWGTVTVSDTAAVNDKYTVVATTVGEDADGNTLSASGEITIIPTPVSSIIITPNNLILAEGESGDVVVTFNPPTATNKNVSFSVDPDDGGITITPGGDGKAKITGVTEGTYKVTATVTLEDGSTAEAVCTVTVMPPPLTVMQVSAGNGHFVVKVEEWGGIWAWGDNAYGQINDSGTPSFDAPVEVTTFASISDIEAIADYSIATATETSGDSWLWGNYPGSNGNPATVKFTDENLGDLLALSESGILTTDGSSEILVWMRTNAEEPPVWAGTAVDLSSIVFADITEIAAGSELGLAIIDGDLYSWDITDPASLNLVGVIDNVGKVFALGKTYYAITDDGALYGWGDLSQLNKGDQASPVEIAGFDAKVTDVAIASDHILVLDENGAVWALGLNNRGQIGNGSSANAYVPYKLPLTDVVSITAGIGSSMAVDGRGKLWGWGNLGLKDYSADLRVPTEINLYPPPVTP